MELPVTEYRLRLSRPLKRSDTPQVRGFFGKRFEEALLLHHHLPEGGLLYLYPCVQFKVLENAAVLLGLGEGAGLLEKLWMQVDHTVLARETLPVLESRVTRRITRLEALDEPLEYRFATPWLALSQENYARYRDCPGTAERTHLLQRILVGNILSIAKRFGYEVEQRLRADCARLRPVRATLKGTPMLGFVGSFRINFALPDLAGCGKSVSRGFGTVVRADRNLGGRAR